VDPATDDAHMRRALELAQEGWGQTAPNPLVGAVVVRNGERVGEGAHRRFGEAHAEVEALRSAADRGRGATLYVNLEPCAHHGKTPPCVDAIIGAGVARVVAATADPDPAAAGGAARLRDSGITVDFDVESEAARELNAPFLHSFASDRPWVTLKLALSLDAALADHTRRPGWLSGVSARDAVHRLRAGSDAIGVGMGTVLADDPALTVRHFRAPRVPPLRVVFSRRGRLPLTSRLAQTAREQPVLVFASSVDPSYEHALRELEVDVQQVGTLREALRALRERGVRALLVEGGARLATSLLADRLVHRLALIQSPVLLGAGALPAFAQLPATTVERAGRLRVVHREPLGDDLLTVFDVASR
jgi:diaminohydroxyphosphoribosylaminopyrimidine deaminase/5-amino-6-(5-phosphoribosylamino)uracil reductase